MEVAVPVATRRREWGWGTEIDMNDINEMQNAIQHTVVVVVEMPRQRSNKTKHQGTHKTYGSKA